jgi:hypothetical protein
VRLIVNDNYSPNNINDILSDEFNSENVSFIKNCGNIGGNANIALGFVFAKPNEFLWILSDHDIVREDAVKSLLSNLNSGLDFIFLDPDAKQERMLSYDWNADNWLDSIYHCGRISGCVYNMNTMASSVSAAFYFHNTSFPHIAVLLAAAKNKKILQFKKMPIDNFIIIDDDYDTSNSKGDYRLYILGAPLLLELMPPKVSKKFARQWLKIYGMDIYMYRNCEYRFVFDNSIALFKKIGCIFRMFLLIQHIKSIIRDIVRKVYNNIYYKCPFLRPILEKLRKVLFN